MNKPNLAILVLLTACGDAEVTQFDNVSLEISILPEGGGPYTRGTGGVGDACGVMLDCATLSCYGSPGASICSMPCGTASCPIGTFCAELPIAMACASDADCAGLVPACQAWPCTCNSFGSCETIPMCFEMCPLGVGTCSSASTECFNYSDGATFDIDLCWPNELP